MKYRTIIADPPWRYDRGGRTGGVDAQYPTMDVSAICALPVSNLARPNATLLLWGTWPKLEWAFQVIKAWGFYYVTGFPWIKIDGMVGPDLFGDIQARPQYGIGYWVRGCSEPILIAKRGDPSLPVNGWVGLLSENLQHSRKPADLYQYAESLPGPYLELFARRKRPGWDVWGNQVASDIALEAV